MGFVFLTQQSVGFLLPFIDRSICWEMFFKIVLEKFTNFTENHLCWSRLILVNLKAGFAAALLKRDSL